MTGRLRQSVAIVWDIDPVEEEISPYLRRLLERGWDAHVLCDRSDLVLDRLAAETRRVRIHPPPLDARRRTPRSGLVAGAIQGWFRRPRAAWRLWSCRDPHLRYLGGVLLALDPAVVHFTSPQAATRIRSVVPAPPPAILITAGDDPPPSRDDELLELRPPAAVADALRILAVGPLVWEEGYEHALQAIRLLADRGVACRYRIVGRGALAEAVGFARHQLGLERLVEIVDPEGRDALRTHLDWADVLVSTAVAPRASRIPLDAMTAARPVVATHLPESDADSGRLIARRDPQALAEALAELAGNRGLLGRLGEAGRARAREAIDAEERLRRFEALYRAALTDGRS